MPTADDLKEFPYRHRGWFWLNHHLIYGVNESDLYAKEIYLQHYLRHNYLVCDYFKYRPDDLLVLNVSEPSAMERLCVFLDVKYTGQAMPHLNKSQS